MYTAKYSYYLIIYWNALLYYGRNSKYSSGLGLLSNEMTVLFSSANTSNFEQTVKKNISQSFIMQTDKIVLWFLVFNKMMMTMVYLLQ